MKEYTALEEMQDELEWEKQKSKKEMRAREQEYKKEMRERKERELNSKIESDELPTDLRQRFRSVATAFSNAPQSAF